MKIKTTIQLSLVEEKDIAYTAGIIDGEGSIWPQKIHCGSRGGNAITVSVGMTSETIPQWLSETWGGTYYFYKSKKPHCKDKWTWFLSSDRAVYFLQIILPYLKLKQKQARIAIDLQIARSKRRPRRATEEEKEIETYQINLMKELNRKGKKEGFAEG